MSVNQGATGANDASQQQTIAYALHLIFGIGHASLRKFDHPRPCGYLLLPGMLVGFVFSIGHPLYSLFRGRSLRSSYITSLLLPLALYVLCSMLTDFQHALDACIRRGLRLPSDWVANIVVDCFSEKNAVVRGAASVMTRASLGP